MKDQLIQSLNAYTTALEQKLSALEQRVAQMEETIRLKGDEAIRQEENIAALQAKVAALTTVGVVAVDKEAEQPIAENEPEVEIELIVDESQEELEMIDTPETLETLDINETPIPSPIEEKTIIPATEEPVAEPAPVVEPAGPIVEPVKEQPLHHNTTQPLQTSLFGSAVEDIRQAISLGDRFLFQRELFAGNGERMQRTLDDLNNLDSFSEAMNYIDQNYDWDKESTAVKLFENVLKRRFN